MSQAPILTKRDKMEITDKAKPYYTAHHILRNSDQPKEK